MKAMNYMKPYRLLVFIVFVFTVGCSTIKPTPEAEAVRDERPWGAGHPPATPEEQYPEAWSIAGSLRGIAK
jgi:hypothetical protein